MTSCVDCITEPQSYANLDDLSEAGVAVGALGSVSFTTQQRALQRASRIADSYLRDRYNLPLECPYDQGLVDAVVQIATWRLMQRRGFNPNDPSDVSLRMGYEDAVKWLTRVANGQAQLCVVQAVPASLQPTVGTNPARGYGGLYGSEDYPVVGVNGAGF